MTSAEVAIERRGGSVVAHLSGEVDMTNSARVRDELLVSVPNDALALVVDLGGCRYLDSAAIEVLFDLARRLGRRRQELRLVLPQSSPLSRVLTLTDVQSVAALHETLDSALGE
ncbi:MAG TPA: STAS domain-containing protein [Thermoleophilaceae bacterium]|nr:STAS domain-containing protein [Thermoleophilaceae bacterium]